MSDPAKSPDEIEDVLASIRRLVSDTGSTSDDTSSVAVEQPQDAPSPDRLVLGPSLRVADSDQEPEAVQESSEAPIEVVEESAWQHEDLMSSFDAVGESKDAEDTLARAVDLVRSDDPADGVDGEGDLGSAAEEDPELAADESFDTSAAAQSDAFMASEEVSEEDIADLARIDGVDGAVLGFDELEAEPADFESETGDENWPSDGAEAALLTLAARRDQAQTAEDPLPLSEPVLADEQSDDDIHDIAAAGSVPVFSRRAATSAEDADAPEADAETTEIASDAEKPSAEPEADAPEPSPVEEHMSDMSEPAQSMWPDVESTEGDPTQADQSAEKADETASISAADKAAADASELDATIFAMTDGEAGILDEETLREIIVDVVREELQGVLGQRITRNVRKMVRREIRLALAAQSLE
ncbi:hypothetical protein V8J82_13090 [Gymnodinialimonas sp. 2305UL16-5]|uniref:hypothetical protein n=1 Tax=Gymnodinialimonas mytili TaxID=3126503 RepID=UPI0030ADD7AD